MKRNQLLNQLLGMLFSFILSVSSTGCLISGFDLPLASITNLILICAVTSLLAAVLLRFRSGSTLLLTLSVLLSVILWRQGALQEQLQTLVLNISTHYHQIYNWPALGADAANAVDVPLILLAWWTAVGVSFYYSNRCHILAVLPLLILPLTACLIVTHTVPDAVYLYLFILAVALLLLTDWVRRHDSEQNAPLILRMIVPVAASLAILFALNPRDGYINRAAELQKKAVTWFQELQNHSGTASGVTDTIGSQKLNLKTVGPKNSLSYAIMRVHSPVSGTLYLRGQDYDTYTGTGWEASQDRSETFTSGGNSAGTLTITTYGTRNLLYIPYYATEDIQLNGGRVENEDNLTRYSYELSLYHAGSQSIQSQENGITEGHVIYVDYHFNPEEQTNLSLGSSRLWAESLAQEITSGCGTPDEKVQAIGDFVRNCAVYDLDTSRMSGEYDDFAQWFLEESDTGYCVHFATAATVLLRASGIPARYVEGYMVTCRAEEDVVVSSKAAHAWAEYYDSDFGIWKILEATPSGAAEETEPGTLPPEESMSTAPPEIGPQATLPKDDPEAPEVTPPGTGEQNQPRRPIKMPRWLKALMQIILLVAMLILQGELRILRKRRRWNRGKPNERALTRWKQSEYWVRWVHIPLPEALYALAEKARFSQHTLTREELLEFDHFRRDVLQNVAAQPVFRKWFLRWILAVG